MSGPVTLVLLPALDGTGIFFDPLLDHLPLWARPRVLTYPAEGPHDYAGLCDLIESRLVDEAAFHLLGWSFGGPLALMLAARNRERVRSVILCASFVTPPIRTLQRLRWCLRAPVVGLARGLWRARFLLPRVGTDRFRAAKAQTWRSVGSRALAARGRAIMRVDERETLRRLEAPLLFLAGSRDGVVGARSVAEVLGCSPNAHLETLPGGHYALFTAAERAAGLIAMFLAHAQRDATPASGRQ